MDLPTIKVRVTVDGKQNPVLVVAKNAKAALALASKLAKKANPEWTLIECEVIDQCLLGD